MARSTLTRRVRTFLSSLEKLFERRPPKKRNRFQTTLAVEGLDERVMPSTTYYVDAVNGSDSNNGTSTATAWNRP